MKPFNPIDIPTEDEITIFEEGRRSIFWQTFKQRFAVILNGCKSSLKNMDCANREFMAGKVNAFESVFNYPEIHIRNLTNIKEKKVDEKVS